MAATTAHRYRLTPWHWARQLEAAIVETKQQLRVVVCKAAT
ncbi:MAG: hypothetical protein ACYDC9_09740 [Dermatophilaceae bacterium]